MEKTNGYYVAKYLKNNALVLVCELVVVLLLSLICSIIMEAEPMWLAPLIAVVTYLVAELRFMMAYVATNARHEHDMAVAKGEIDEAEDEETAEAEDEQPTPVADAALFMAAAVTAEQDDEDEQTSDDFSDENEQEDQAVLAEEDEIEPEDEAENEDEAEDEPEAEDKPDPAVEEAIEAEAEVEHEEQADDSFSRELKFQLNKFLNKRKEQPAEPTVEQEPEDEDVAEPVFDDVPARTPLEIDDEDEAMDALFGAPASEQADIALASIDMADDELDGMTMDGDDFARDVLEIGEIDASAPSDGEQ